MRLTGTSSFLFESVRGTSSIRWIASGTWRGEQCSRTRRRISPASSSSSSAEVTTNNRMRSSTSTTSESSTSETPSIAEYSSLVPIRTPPRLMVESERP
jgi:hypothetical protein